MTQETEEHKSSTRRKLWYLFYGVFMVTLIIVFFTVKRVETIQATVTWDIIVMVAVFLAVSIFLTRSNRKVDIYDTPGPFVKNIKITMQMFIGVGLVGLIFLKTLHLFSFHQDFLNTAFPFLNFVYQQRMLELVGLTLAYSSAIDLAYTLFTPGPDEAVDPLITGLAATILLFISKSSSFDLTETAGIVFLVLALAGLFLIKKAFVSKKEGADHEEIDEKKGQAQDPFVVTNDIVRRSQLSEKTFVTKMVLRRLSFVLVMILLGTIASVVIIHDRTDKKKLIVVKKEMQW
jgi:Ca2+/Na+ antiporter